MSSKNMCTHVDNVAKAIGRHTTNMVIAMMKQMLMNS